MKKTLALLVALLISVGAMAQDALQEAIESVNGYWKIEGDNIVVSATIKTSMEDISARIAQYYNNIEFTDTSFAINGKSFSVNADEFIDYNARKYKANYIIEASYDTLLYINVIIGELDSKTDADDCRMIELYPVNSERRMIADAETSLRNDERIKYNEGIIFSKIISKAIDEIKGLGKFIGGEVMFEASIDETSVVIKDMSETQVITMHLDKYRKTALTGEVMMLGGGALAMSSIFIDYPNRAKAAMICGGIIGIAGYITRLTAYSHLKPNKVSFSANGVAYSF